MGQEIVSLRLSAELSALDQFRLFALEQAQAQHVPDSLLPKLELALEEILVNVMSYAYPEGEGEGEVELACHTTEADFFCVRIRDWGAPFDPLAKDAPDLTQDVAHREIGGLGIYFVQEMSDSLCYERKEGANVLEVCFLRTPLKETADT